MPKKRARVLVEECRYLDVRRLSREDVLVVDTLAEVRWGDQYTAKLHVTGTPEYPSRAGILKIDGLQSISLAWTACHYGGERPWFRCPQCNRRCAKLLDYHGHGFRCRQCYGAGYAIENEIPEWRLRRRVEKLEGQLADGHERPKGMHQTTYQRLCDEIIDAEELADALFVEKVSRRFPELAQ